MICNKCNTSAVLNTALGKDFYFCRTCKDEVMPEVVVSTESVFRESETVYFWDMSKDILQQVHPTYKVKPKVVISSPQPDDSFEAVKDWYDFKVGDICRLSGHRQMKFSSEMGDIRITSADKDFITYVYVDGYGTFVATKEQARNLTVIKRGDNK